MSATASGVGLKRARTEGSADVSSAIRPDVAALTRAKRSLAESLREKRQELSRARAGISELQSSVASRDASLALLSALASSFLASAKHTGDPASKPARGASNAARGANDAATGANDAAKGANDAAKGGEEGVAAAVVVALAEAEAEALRSARGRVRDALSSGVVAEAEGAGGNADANADASMDASVDNGGKGDRLLVEAGLEAVAAGEKAFRDAVDAARAAVAGSASAEDAARAHAGPFGLASLAAEVASLKRTVARLECDLEDASDARDAALRKVTRSVATVAEREAECESLKEKCSDLEGKVEAASSAPAASASSSAPESSENAAADSEALRAAEAAAKVAKEEIESLRDAADAARADAEEARAEIRGLTAQVASRDKAISEARKESAALREDIARATSRLVDRAAQDAAGAKQAADVIEGGRIPPHGASVPQGAAEAEKRVVLAERDAEDARAMQRALYDDLHRLKASHRSDLDRMEGQFKERVRVSAEREFQASKELGSTLASLEECRRDLAAERELVASLRANASIDYRKMIHDLTAHIVELQETKRTWRARVDAIVASVESGAVDPAAARAALSDPAGIRGSSGGSSGGGGGGGSSGGGGGGGGSGADGSDREAFLAEAANSATAERDAARADAEKFKSELGDLRCLLEVFQSGGSDADRSAAEVRAAEKKAIKERDAAVEEARALKDNLAAANKRAEEAEAKGAGQPAPADSNSAGDAPAPAGKDVESLRAKVEALTFENEALQEEIDEMVGSFSALEQQSTTLSNALSSREESAEAAVHERAKTERIRALLAAERDSLLAEVRASKEEVISFARAAAAAESRATHAESAAQLGSKEVSELARKAMDVQEKASAFFNLLHGVEAQINELRGELSSAHESIKDKVTEAERFEDKARAREDDISALKRKLERAKREITNLKNRTAANAGGGAASASAGQDKYASDITDVQVLQAEVNKYRDMTRCSVCRTNPKSVVITKCMHSFCGQCIRRNLEVRNRKCPGCSIRFGADDVREVFLGFE